MRMDKWLWAARFFKTRSLAAHVCELGRVQSNGIPAKPSREVKAGDMLKIKNDAGEFLIEVLALAQLRGPAAVAQTLYRETEESKTLRAKTAEARRNMPLYEAAFQDSGRPSKRDRRELDRLRGGGRT